MRLNFKADVQDVRPSAGSQSSSSKVGCLCASFLPSDDNSTVDVSNRMTEHNWAPRTECAYAEHDRCGTLLCRQFCAPRKY